MICQYRIMRLVCLLLAVATTAFAAGPPVAPEWINAGASSSFIPSMTGPGLIVDESGLNGDLHDNSSNGATMWLSASGGGGTIANNPAGIDGPAWLRFDFLQPVALDELWIWNHNQANLTDRGLRHVALHIRTPEGDWISQGDHVLTRAPGTPDYPPGDVIDLSGATATAVLLTALPGEGNYGSAYYGLSEIRFFGDLQGCAPAGWPVAIESVAVDDVYTSLFSPRAEGWLGSDVAHSIPIDGTRSVWLFGDTLIGRVENGHRATGAAFINNSIGILDSSKPLDEALVYYWGPANTSFFPHQPGTPGSYYWPTNGIMLGGELFLFCYSITPGGAFGFMIEHATLIRVANPLDDPASWSWTASDFGIGGDNFNMHTALRVEEPWVYFLGTQNDGNPTSKAVLGRMQADDLLAGLDASAMEFWSNTPTGPAWTSTTDDLVALFRPSNTESHIQYIPDWDLYLATTYNPFDPVIRITAAHELTGPWEDPVCFYAVPEHRSVSFDIISYAARLHPELSTSTGELVMSYATNTLGTLAPLFTEEGLGIYHPRFVRARIQPQVPGDTWMLH